jgi:TM2 domain-containing membrane protein YozV
MTRTLLFWVILVVWVLFAGAAWFGVGREYGVAGIPNLVELALFVLLGWQVYGPPIRGG